MVEDEKIGMGVIAGTDVGNPDQMIFVCLSSRTYRPEQSKDWRPLPTHWGQRGISPLSRLINVRIIKGTLRSFFDAISEQTKLYFYFGDGLENCPVTAILRDISAREAFQISIEAGGLSYQQIGRSDTYGIIPRRRGIPACTPTPPSKAATGSCKDMDGDVISLDCENGPLYSFAEIVSAQSKASFYFWNGAEDYPITTHLAKAKLERAMKNVRKNDSLIVRQLKKRPIYAIAVETP
jgi:hypothetical protein